MDDGWNVIHEQKPECWRRVEVLRGYGAEFGLITRLSSIDDLIFRPDDYDGSAWSASGRQGEPHGYYLSGGAQWRYLNDKTEYRSSRAFRAALDARPSSTLGPMPVVVEPLDPEAAWEESVYMAIILQLEDDYSLLRDAWQAYRAAQPITDGACGVSGCGLHPIALTATTFVAVVNDTTGLDCRECVVCHQPEWEDNCHSDVSDNDVCDDCRGTLSSCCRCEDWSATDEDYLTWVDGDRYCDSCRDNYTNWCDHCEEYYHPDNGGDHGHDDYSDCVCTPLDLHFEILANSHGVLHQDERLLVELPKGFVTDAAIDAICNMLWTEQLYPAWIEDNSRTNWVQLTTALRTMERTWQTKQGNFTKRLSKLMYQQFGLKLDPGLLSRTGSLVKEHGNAMNSWHVEFTRDLNQPAHAFANSGSCWWGSESQSLCALKHWGGFAIRSYSSQDQDRQWPDGRAWIQPLNENLAPTADILGAHAYVVYNGYGNLHGYTAARLVSYLTSRSYRKVSLGIDYQYVNSESGYLVADQAVCDATESVSINNLNPHEAVAA